MSEGDLHGRLVRALLDVMRGFGDEGSLIVSADVSSDNANLRPPVVSAVRPDVFVRHRVSNRVWIGEAKSTRDVDTIHTRFQLESYFEYLAKEREGTLYIAVPMQSAGEAFRVARGVRQVTKCTYVPFVVTGWVLGVRSSMRSWGG